MNKQIEEMANSICKLGLFCFECDKRGRCMAYKYAKRAYNAGYRKQVEGECKPQIQDCNYYDTLECSICGEVIDISQCDYNFCPNCGAKMKGGEQE